MDKTAIEIGNIMLYSCDGSKKQQAATNRNKPHLKRPNLRNLVGLERFELSSVTPEATSLDQASRQPHLPRAWAFQLSSLKNHENKPS
jgi:hypothetical protein